MWWDKIRQVWQHTNRQPAEHNALACRSRRAIRREQGQSLVEFAVILPVLLLIVLATVDLGMGFKTYIALTNAAREGARWVSIYPGDQNGSRSRIRAEASLVGLTDDVFAEDYYTVSFSPGGPYAAGDKVTVNVEYNYELLFGAVTNLPAIPFTASATMVVLYDE